MSWSFLPSTHADNKAAFVDSDGAARWLAGQPQANAVAMLASLVEQIESFNACGVAPRERFKTLEVLRRAVFAASGEGLRRYEHKALPLLPAEQQAFDHTRRLWRACALAYLHCLAAARESDPAIVDQHALVAHRALSCLRLEQMSCYVAGAQLDVDFWTIVHSLWGAAEALGITHQPVSDPQLRETFESTLSGQYAMALMLHLARPYSFLRGQFAATTRWLSRWRELAVVQTRPERQPESCAIALDLSSSAPVHDALRAAGVARWLVLDRVLRKMRQRQRSLANGESPESLKLGSGLSPAECMALLTALGDRLSDPLVAEMPDQGESMVLAAGLENAYRLLGGAPLTDEVAAPTSSFASQLVVEQLAVFGHVVRAAEVSADRAAELWRMVTQDANEMHLIRNAADGGARLMLRSLLVIRLPPDGRQLLATISSLGSRRDGRLCVSASLLAGNPMPLLAEVHEKPAGKLSRHPAILLMSEADAAPQVFLPAGLPGRALSIRFFDSRGQSCPALVLADCLARGGDHERWTVAASA